MVEVGCRHAAPEAMQAHGKLAAASPVVIYAQQTDSGALLLHGEHHADACTCEMRISLALSPVLPPAACSTAGSKHTFWCSGSEELLLLATLAPPGPMAEAFYENLAGLGATYGDVARIHPLQLVVLLQGGGVQVEDLPRVMSWAIQRLLVPFAQLLGFTASYPQYVSAGAAGLSHD